jgi:hypothetical protein
MVSRRALLLLLEVFERRDELEGGDANDRPLGFDCQLSQVGWIGLRYLSKSGSPVWAELQDESSSVARVRHTSQNSQLMGRHHPGRTSWMSLEVPRRSTSTHASGAQLGPFFSQGSIDKGERRRTGHVRAFCCGC